MRFIDLFAGLGGFHRALSGLGHECVFASELDEELRSLYKVNFPNSKHHVYGDIRESKEFVPAHDILCAGFPCQPFSKSGSQLGMLDETRGSLFHEILEILQVHRPRYVILENVGNFERHDCGRTWLVVRQRLEALGYTVAGTVHRGGGGHGLISPHHFGHPHHRERFFIVAELEGTFVGDPFPRGERTRCTSLHDITQSAVELAVQDGKETALSQQQIACIKHWDRLLKMIPNDVSIPSIPLWGDEIEAEYPFEEQTPFSVARERLLQELDESHPAFWERLQESLSHLPSYATRQEFPRWKQNFIRGNRRWFSAVSSYFPPGWIDDLRRFPASLRKLEWNCQGEERDLWQYVLQFRPSGLRVKRYSSIPALVAMTTTQIPVLGPEGRFLTRVEGLRLQGMPDYHQLPRSRERAFAALGNAVHVDVVTRIAEKLIGLSCLPPLTEAGIVEGALCPQEEFVL